MNRHITSEVIFFLQNLSRMPLLELWTTTHFSFLRANETVGVGQKTQSLRAIDTIPSGKLCKSLRGKRAFAVCWCLSSWRTPTLIPTYGTYGDHKGHKSFPHKYTLAMIIFSLAYISPCLADCWLLMHFVYCFLTYFNYKWKLYCKDQYFLYIYMYNIKIVKQNNKNWYSCTYISLISIAVISTMPHKMNQF